MVSPSAFLNACLSVAFCFINQLTFQHVRTVAIQVRYIGPFISRAHLYVLNFELNFELDYGIVKRYISIVPQQTSEGQDVS